MSVGRGRPCCFVGCVGCVKCGSNGPAGTMPCCFAAAELPFLGCALCVMEESIGFSMLSGPQPYGRSRHWQLQAPNEAYVCEQLRAEQLCNVEDMLLYLLPDSQFATTCANNAFDTRS